MSQSYLLKNDKLCVHFSFKWLVLFWWLVNRCIQNNVQKVNETCLIFILGCPTDTHISGNRWLCFLLWHMKGSELPAFIVSHFGKILPVLAVNPNMPFLWKILHCAAHNITDCCFLSNPYSNSLCIISFPVRMKRECNYILPIILPPLPKKKNFLYCIGHCASWMVSGVEVAVSGENDFFAVIHLGCGMEALFKSCFGALQRSDQTTGVTPSWWPDVWC